MNRNQASGFQIPFSTSQDESFDMDLDLTSGQKSPSPSANYNDSPDRETLEETSEVDVKETIRKIELKMKERMKTVTVKESLVLLKSGGRMPGFMGLSLRFTPSFANDEIKSIFTEKMKTIEQELSKAFAEKLEAVIDPVNTTLMREAYDILQKTYNSLDIKDPKSGEIRTKLSTEFDSLMEKYKRERAKYASKIRAGTAEGGASKKVPTYFTAEGRKKLKLKKSN